MAKFSGHLFLRAERRDDGRTTLAEQAFRAPFHLSKPYWDDHALIVQVVNPTAGILAGDRLESEVAVGAGAALFVTSPSATRIFHMKDGSAECHQRFNVAGGGWLEVMPEPLVLHRGSRYRQTTQIELEQGGELFFADLLMPGRIARGEAWAWEKLAIELQLRVGGGLVLRERLAQSGEELRRLAALAGMGESACFANLLLVSARLSEDTSWREAIWRLHGNGIWAGLSELRGACHAWSLRLIAADTIALKRALTQVRGTLVSLLPRLASDPRKL